MNGWNLVHDEELDVCKVENNCDILHVFALKIGLAQSNYPHC